MTLLSFRQVFLPGRRCARTILACYLSQQAARSGKAHDQASFEAAGVRPLVAASLRSAFPNVREPTAMQRKLIRAMAENRNVLLQDDTGTGKSFAAMLALLSKPPARKASAMANMGESGTVPTLASLLLVPHRDLAYQYLNWIDHMTQGETPTGLTRHAQMLVRHANKGTLQGLPSRMQDAIRSALNDQDLVRKPPRILIATPNAMLELLERLPETLRLVPSTVVVDEVDALLRVPGAKLPRERRKATQRKPERHTPDLVRVLDRLYPKGGSGYRPQLVMISATLRYRLQSALFNTFGWVRRGEMLRLMRKRSSAKPAHRLARSAIHHVLVVTKTGEIKNIEGARPAEETGPLEEDAIEDSADEGGIFYDDEDDAELVDEGDTELIHAPLAFDPVMLEAVAGTVAVEVPRVALLVLPATAAVRKIVFELRQLGVNAHALDLAESKASRGGDGEDPVLIVGTVATIRGMDLADLTHVFLLGVPEGRSGDVYVHVAGRVGRFGGRGRVVSIVEERDAVRMRTVLGRLGLAATRMSTLI